MTNDSAGWAVGQSTTPQGERVRVMVGYTAIDMSEEAATQFATALLIAARNVGAVNSCAQQPDDEEPAGDADPITAGRT